MTADARRVLFIDQEPRLSGGQMVLRDLIECLVRRNVDVHLAVPGVGALSAAAAAAGVAVHHYPLADSLRSVSRWDLARNPLSAVHRTREIARSCRELDRIVRRVSPDIVHTNSLKAHLLTVPAMTLRRRPHVWHVQDIVDGTPGTLLAAAATLDAARVVCSSEAVAASFPGRLRPRLRVVYNSVSQHRADAAAASAFRRAIGVGDHQLLVTMVGQIARWKGQDLLVEAARRLAARSDLRFAVVGECLYPENEGRYEATTRQQSAELGSLVTWTGRVEPIDPVMAGSDIIVHASRLPEPFGRVIVEAMVQRTPVISNRIGAAPELVTPDVGVLVAPDDAAALADAIAALADDEPRRAAMAERAPHVAARYSPERLADGVLAVYDEVLARA